MLRLLLGVVLLYTVCVLTVGNPTAQLYRAANATGRYIIVMRNDLGAAFNILGFKDKLNAKFGVRPDLEFRLGKFLALTTKADETIIRRLLAVPEIHYIEEDGVVKMFDEAKCKDYDADMDRWGLVRLSSRDEMPNRCGSSCKYKYSSNDDGQGTYVYVLDTGIYLNHNQFEGRASWGFTISDIDETNDDHHGHGTHVAGIAAGHSHGVARAAKVVAVKVLDKTGEGSTAGVIYGLNWTCDDIKQNDRKAVINLSLGSPGKSPALEDIIQEALNHGIPVVIAAGNEDGMDACGFSPASLGKTTNAITVGATNDKDELASFSNNGDCINILAPGDKIKAAGIVHANHIATYSGTSMAAPFVAGAIARMITNSSLYGNPAEIKNALLQASTRDLISMSTTARERNTPNKVLYTACNSAMDRSSGTFISLYVAILFYLISSHYVTFVSTLF